MREGVVDRLENDGEIIVVETPAKDILVLHIEMFADSNVHVNDYVYETPNGLWAVDKKKTQERTAQVEKLMNELFEKEDGNLEQ